MGRIWSRYTMRLRRKRMLWRALRARHQLTAHTDRTGSLAPNAILAFSTIRNEEVRLPHFLDHYRNLGVDHFLFVDNGSDDGTADLLADQPDVSLWQTQAGYKASRFGMDWLGWLLLHYGHGHWCLTVDADEILIYPFWDSHDLHKLTGWLDHQGARAFGAHMLDMYPKGPIDAQTYRAGDDPFSHLAWFDNGPWRATRQEPMGNLWVQGGARERFFFRETPERSPTLNKLPLVKWNRRWAYVNSTHALLPPRLNLSYDGPGNETVSGVLLHSKLLPVVIEKSREEKLRHQHFSRPEGFSGYYDGLIEGPDLWTAESLPYEGWRQLEALGLMSRGTWDAETT